MTRVQAQRLVMCSKSRWHPAIRREHHLAVQAAIAGVPVTFLENANDVRALRGSARGSFLRTLLTGAQRWPDADIPEGIEVFRRSVPAPGHRGGIALRLENWFVYRDLRHYDVPGTVVVAMTPWLWPAVSRMRHARRVVDLGDDWSTLIPARAKTVKYLHDRIAADADEVVVAAPALATVFGRRRAVTVRNATDRSLVDSDMIHRPRRRRLVYVGTLSERFDAPLVSAILDRLPDWSLDLYGPCWYAGCGNRPSAELVTLIARGNGRVSWHGPIPRSALCAAIDAGDVLIIPNRPEMSLGQDSMKLYDYLARGRPVVTTAMVAAEGLPGVHIGYDAESFAAGICLAEGDDESVQREQRVWARSNTYAERWHQWWAAVSGNHGISEAKT